MTDSDSGAHVTDVGEITSQEGDSDLRREGKNEFTIMYFCTAFFCFNRKLLPWTKTLPGPGNWQIVSTCFIEAGMNISNLLAQFVSVTIGENPKSCCFDLGTFSASAIAAANSVFMLMLALIITL